MNHDLRTKLATVIVASYCVFVPYLVLGQAHSTPTGEGFSQKFKAEGPQNAQSCSGCHAVPTLGGSSKVAVMRMGHRVAGHYVPNGRDGTLHVLSDTLGHNDPKHSIGLRVVL